jgi:hypothetical protein
MQYVTFFQSVDSARQNKSISNIFQRETEPKTFRNSNKKLVTLRHRFLIEVDCSLVIQHNSKLNGVQTIQTSQVFLALLSL